MPALVDTCVSLDEVSLVSKKRRRRRRKKRGKRKAANEEVVKNMGQMDQHVDFIPEGNKPDDTLEVDSTPKLSQKHQKPDSVSTTNPSKKPVHTRKKKKKPKVTKKAEGVSGIRGLVDTDILLSLSLADACNQLTNECLTNAANGGLNLLVPNEIAVRSPVCSRRKLLILDINGLLADIVMPPPLDRKADRRILGRAIFKRPFYYDFLKFCFERFDVGIWSSRSKRIIDGVVDYLLGDLKSKLLFCWDMNQCTVTGFKTLENVHKPLVCKELRKLWEKHYPNLPWNKGDYDVSNTLLLDDSPYKALLNPIHSGIFPPSYHYGNKVDNSLGPGGDLRAYLEGLAFTDNIQKYIEQHPFGQRAIDETSSSWGFYSKVLSNLAAQSIKR